MSPEQGIQPYPSTIDHLGYHLNMIHLYVSTYMFRLHKITLDVNLLVLWVSATKCQIK